MGKHYKDINEVLEGLPDGAKNLYNAMEAEAVPRKGSPADVFPWMRLPADAFFFTRPTQREYGIRSHSQFNKNLTALKEAGVVVEIKTHEEHRGKVSRGRSVYMLSDKWREMERPEPAAVEV